MPLYEVHHTIPLTPSQQDDLAAALTRIHSTKFTTPTFFVNVKFTDASAHPFYTGGKRRPRSYILAHVRAGPSRSRAEFNALCAEVARAWEDIVKPLPKVRRSAPDEERSLHGVFVLGDISAGLEGGFEIPEAGGDVQWLSENMQAFKARAECGEEEYADLVKEVEDRGLLAGYKTAIQRLEEELGWGDSA